MKKAELRQLVPKARDLAGMLKSLAHETRLLAVCHIGAGEVSVQDLEALIGSTQSNLSQHLARLKASGILRSRREGKQIFYGMGSEEVYRLILAMKAIYCPEASGDPARRRK